MSDSNPIQEAVSRIVAEVFDQQLPKLQSLVAQRVAEEVASAGSGDASGLGIENPAAPLNAAAVAIQNGNSQAEILVQLLDGGANFASRVALFVLRGSSAVGWQARGFPDNNFIKQFTLDPGNGLAGRALRDRGSASAAAAEFSSDFVKAAGNPSDGNCIVLPLLVREKTPGFVYADRGQQSGGKLDTSALELLVRLAGLWLETVAARRAGTPVPGTDRIAEGAITPTEKVVEKPVAAPPPPAPVVPPERIGESVVPAAKPAPPPPPAPIAAAAAAPAPAAAAIQPGDEEVHKKAKRFAKLLVDEIKLYNQAKVAEGRQKKDLYDRLKDDIDKSRATYDKRYGSSPAATGDYFTQELIRILAENDVALLGGSFPRP